MPPPPVESSRDAAAEFSTFAANLRRQRAVYPLVDRIPKATRTAVTDSFSSRVKAVVSDNSICAWQKLFEFACVCLPIIPSQGQKISLAAIIRQNLTQVTPLPASSPAKEPRKNKDESWVRRTRVEKKFSLGDIAGAARLLMSDDAVLDTTEAVTSALREKHPSALLDPNYPPAPTANAMLHNTVVPAEVRRAILTFPNGSAAGFDGLAPQHLKDMINGKTAASQQLLTALSDLLNLMLGGRIPAEICPYIYGASLVALGKKDGGVRPIAVGHVLRRLAGKIVSGRVNQPMGALLRPKQFGYGTQGGMEAVVHASRAYCEAESPACRVLLKLDWRNAFNAVRRDALLHMVLAHLPEYYSFIWQMYRHPTTLFFGDDLLSSECGVQQGDPLGPLLFCLVTRVLNLAVQSPLNVWYLDDGTIAGPPDTVLQDFAEIIRQGAAIGLTLNFRKCEAYIFGSNDSARAEAAAHVAAAIPGVAFTARADLLLLGSPLFNEAVPGVLAAKTNTLRFTNKRLPLITPHIAFFLLRACFGVVRTVYVLRTARSWHYLPQLMELDEVLREGLITITNVHLTGDTWAQSTLR